MMMSHMAKILLFWESVAWATHAHRARVTNSGLFWCIFFVHAPCALRKICGGFAAAVMFCTGKIRDGCFVKYKMSC